VRPAALIAALLLCAGCGGSEPSGAQEPQGSDDAAPATPVAPRSVPKRHPPASESVLRFLRAQQEPAGAHERLTAAARETLPTDVSVWCWDEEVWAEVERRIARELGEEEVTYAGLADQYAHDIHLEAWACEVLGRLAPGSPDEEIVQAEALNLFAHETRHFSSSGSLEAATECSALQRMDEIGITLGASAEHARRLTRIAWEDVYPFLPPEYRSPQCKAGGTLDREPETPEFP
jgi:hypothetical protein